MSGLGDAGAEPIGSLISAVNSRDVDALRPLLADDVELRTGRGVHRGIDAVLRWAERTYEHLERRYMLDELVETEVGMLALGRVQYVWREEGQIGDEAPIWLGFELHDGRVHRIALYEDEGEARQALGEPGA